jgi:hypothetical protein
MRGAQTSTNRIDSKVGQSWHKFAVTSNNFYDPRSSTSKNANMVDSAMVI